MDAPTLNQKLTDCFLEAKSAMGVDRLLLYWYDAANLPEIIYSSKPIVIFHLPEEATEEDTELEFLVNEQPVKVLAQYHLPPDDMVIPVDGGATVEKVYEIGGVEIARVVDSVLFFSLYPNCLMEANEEYFLPFIKDCINDAFKIIVTYIKERDRKETFNKYVAIKVEEDEKRVNNVSAQISSCVRDIEAYTQSLRRTTRSLYDFREQLDLLSTRTAEMTREAAEKEYNEFVKFVDSGAVKKFDIVSGNLVVTIPPVYIVSEHKKYHIGELQITIKMGLSGSEGERPPVIIKNLTHNSSSMAYPHPHVNSDGNPCLGSMATPLSKLWGQKDFVGMINALIIYLQSYNKYDAHRQIVNWPVVETYTVDVGTLPFDKCFEVCRGQQPLNCLTCTRYECPHISSAFQRCYTMSSNDCEACGNLLCPFKEVELQECRLERISEADGEGVEYCVDRCSITRCPYRGASAPCMVFHRGAWCSDCATSSCTYYQGYEERDEDNDNEEEDE